jgi:hypothetical protein
MALPPGGPNEQRGGASVTITDRVVQPVGSTTPPPANVTQPVGKVRFTGTGFSEGELVQVKIDDGAVRPDQKVRPPAPEGSQPNSDDWFVAVRATGTPGTISGEVDLADVLAADAPALKAGKHHLRFVSTYGPQGQTKGRSIHADFAISDVLPRPSNVNGGRLTLGPGAAIPVAETPEREYDGIPKLLGTLVPYAVSGLDPNQVFNLRLNDSQTFLLQDAVAGPDGTASGLVAMPAAASQNPSVNWLRLLTGTKGGTVRSIVAPFALPRCTLGRSVLVSTTAPQGGTLRVVGTGLLKEAFYLNGTPGNTGDGQTISVVVDGAAAQHIRADNTGRIDGTIPVPTDAAVDSDVSVTVYSGFRAGSDFPQAVWRRTFRVTAAGTDAGPLPDPEPMAALPRECDPATEPPSDPPITTTPQAPPAVVTPPAPKPAPMPAPAPERAARVASTSLKVAKNRIALELARGSVARKVAVTVRTKAKVRVGKRTKVVTLAKATSTLKAGTAKQSTTLKLKLTAEGRALLKRVTKVRVVVRVAPTAKGAKATTRTVWLRG